MCNAEKGDDAPVGIHMWRRAEHSEARRAVVAWDIRGEGAKEESGNAHWQRALLGEVKGGSGVGEAEMASGKGISRAEDAKSVMGWGDQDECQVREGAEMVRLNEVVDTGDSRTKEEGRIEEVVSADERERRGVCLPRRSTSMTMRGDDSEEKQGGRGNNMFVYGFLRVQTPMLITHNNSTTARVPYFSESQFLGTWQAATNHFNLKKITTGPVLYGPQNLNVNCIPLSTMKLTRKFLKHSLTKSKTHGSRFMVAAVRDYIPMSRQKFGNRIRRRAGYSTAASKGNKKTLARSPLARRPARIENGPSGFLWL
ncbi:hypothetical protein R3P38DRAFT_3559751 [Favolaschia claudopus]|uniref:Uncharacterized protein n=1 Tax=Favolaschia claudopus TaxID=2862362 RepID=A0AAW0AVY3_9AGAR